MGDLSSVSELIRDPAAAASPTGAQGFRACRYHSQDGLELYYRDYGDPGSERIPVLCLPGLTRNSKDFHDLALHLAPTRRVLAPDYRGRGLSARDPDWRNYRPETYIGDLLDLLAVADAPRVITVGTSMGGLLSLGLAVFRPTCLAGAVLNDIGPDVNPVGYQRILDYISTDRPQPDWDAAVAYTRELFPNVSMETEAEWRDLADSTYRLGEDGLLHYDWDVALAKTLTESQARFPDLWAVFRALEDRPALALRGALSDVLTEATFDRMAEVKPDLLRATVPNVGHVPALDEKEAILALDDFFARI
jgi:pimeloyl-ACP methyl ester carboxylesterase